MVGLLCSSTGLMKDYKVDVFFKIVKVALLVSVNACNECKRKYFTASTQFNAVGA